MDYDLKRTVGIVTEVDQKSLKDAEKSLDVLIKKYEKFGKDTVVDDPALKNISSKLASIKTELASLQAAATGTANSIESIATKPQAQLTNLLSNLKQIESAMNRISKIDMVKKDKLQKQNSGTPTKASKNDINFLTNQQKKIQEIESKFRASLGAKGSKIVDGSLNMLTGDVTKTVDSFVDSIKTKIQDALQVGLTNNVRASILQDINALSLEIQAQQAANNAKSALDANRAKTEKMLSQLESRASASQSLQNKYAQIADDIKNASNQADLDKSVEEIQKLKDSLDGIDIQKTAAENLNNLINQVNTLGLNSKALSQEFNNIRQAIQQINDQNGFEAVSAQMQSLISSLGLSPAILDDMFAMVKSLDKFKTMGNDSPIDISTIQDFQVKVQESLQNAKNISKGQLDEQIKSLTNYYNLLTSVVDLKKQLDQSQANKAEMSSLEELLKKNLPSGQQYIANSLRNVGGNTFEWLIVDAENAVKKITTTLGELGKLKITNVASPFANEEKITEKATKLGLTESEAFKKLTDAYNKFREASSNGFENSSYQKLVDSIKEAEVECNKLINSVEKLHNKINDSTLKLGEQKSSITQQVTTARSDGTTLLSDATVNNYYNRYIAAIEAVEQKKAEILGKTDIGAVESAQWNLATKTAQTYGNALQKLIEQKTMFGSNAALNELESFNNLLGSSMLTGENARFVQESENMKSYIQLIEELRSNLTSLDLSSNVNQQKLLFDTNNVQASRKELEQYIKEYEDFLDLQSRGVGRDLDTKIDTNKKSAGQIQTQIESAVTAANAGSYSFGKYNEITRTLSYTFTDTSGAVHDMEAKILGLNNTLVTTGKTVGQADSVFKQFLGSAGKNIVSVTKQFFSFYMILNQIRQGVTYIREIDSALTEIKKVTDETDETYQHFLQTMSKTAGTVGSTVSNLTTSAADWARLGYTIEEAGELAKNTQILMNVSEFDDVSTATDTLISSLQAFKNESMDVGDFSMQIIDEFNEVGNNYAISTSDLADSLTRSSASLVAAGNTLEQSIALTTAANTVIQNPESVGNALKVISMRVRGVKTELEAAGEETDGMVTNTSKLQEKIKALTSEANGGKGIDILTDDGAFKSTYDILLSISKIWSKMNDMDQAALLELIAGKQRGSVVASLLQHPDIIESAYNSASNASGSAQQELNTYLNSIEGKIAQFTSAIQTMWMNAVDSDIIKFFVDVGTAAVKLVDTIGLIPTALGTLTAFNAFPVAKKYFDEIHVSADAAAQAVQRESAADTAETITSQMNALANKEQKDGYTNVAAAADNATRAVERQKISDAAEGAGSSGLINSLLSKFSIKNNDIKNIGSSFGKQLIAGAKAVVVSGIIGAGITAVTSLIGMAYNLWKEKQEEMQRATEAALDSVQSLQTDQDSIEDYKSQVKDLQATLRDSNSTHEEVYNAKTKLLSIQDSLIDKYGAEASSINLVNGELSKQIDQLDRLSEVQAKQWYTENLSAYRNAAKIVDEKYSASFGFNYDDVANGLSNMQNSQEAKKIQESFTNGLLKILSDANVDASKIEDMTNLDSIGIRYENMTTAELEQLFDSINSYLVDFSSYYKINLDNEIAQINAMKNKYLTDEYNQAKELYDAGAKQELIASYADEYNAILDAQEKFYSAANYDEQLQALNIYAQKVRSLFQVVGGSIDTEGIFHFDEKSDLYHLQQYISSFNDLINQNQPTIEFKAALSEDDSQLQDDLKEIFKDNKNISILSDVDIKQMQSLASKYEDINNFNGKFNPNTYAEFGNADYTSDQINGFKQLILLSQQYGLALEDVITIMAQFGYISSDSIEVQAESIQKIGQSYATLSSTVSQFSSVIGEKNEALYNGIEISEDYYNSLVELIGDENDLSECIDTQNGYIVKNVDLINDLVKEKKNDTAETIKNAKAQAQLEYNNLVQQLGATISATDEFNNKTLNTVSSLLSQIDTVQYAISQYSMLEDQLLGTTSAFDKFNQAQEIDSLNTYTDDYVSMVQTIYDAMYETGKVGTEAFNAAVEALVPDEAYAGLESDAEKLQAIYQYFNKYIKPSLTFDQDNKTFSMEYDNIEKFVNKAKEVGALVEDKNGIFDFGPGINSLKDFADAIGKTEAESYAFLKTFDDFNYGDGSLLLKLDNSLSGQITQTNAQLQDLYEQKIALLQQGDYDPSALKALNDDIAKAESLLQQYQHDAYNNWKEYDSEYSKYDQVLATLVAVEDQQKKLSEYNIDPNSWGLNNIDFSGCETVEEYAQRILEQMRLLEQPVVLTAQYAIDDIDQQIKEKNCELAKKGTSEDRKIELQGEIAQLNIDREKIAKQYGIALDEINTEEYLGQIEEFTIGDKTFKIIVDDTEAIDRIKNLQSMLDELNGGNVEPTTPTDETINNYHRSLQQTNSSYQQAAQRKYIDTDSLGNRFATNSFGNATTIQKYDGSYVVITPVLPDGTRLDNDTWGRYIQSLTDGTDSPIDNPEEYQLASFSGWSAQAQQDAEEYANAINSISKAWDVLLEATKTNPISNDIEFNGEEIAQELADLTFNFEEFSKSAEDSEIILKLENFETLLKDNGYGEDTIQQLFSVIGETIQNSNFGQSIISQLNSADGSIQSTTALLDNLGIAYSEATDENGIISISVDGSQLNTLLSLLGYTDTQISALQKKWNANGITIDSNFNSTGLSEATESIAEVPSETFSDITARVSGTQEVINLHNEINKLPTYKQIVIETKRKTTYETTNSASALGTARAFGTAHASGDWGLRKTEHNALLGELGPEIIVDPHSGYYRTVGDHGAEIVETLPKDAIIFDHIQTKQLLSSHRTNSRGHMFANGTAHAEGTAHALWKPKNNKGVKSKTTTSKKKSSSSKSGSRSGSGSSSSTEEFEEMFDWFAVLIEEIDEDIDYLQSKLQNVFSIGSKKNIYGEMLDDNRYKLKELNEGLKLYNDYANKLIKKIPSQYRDLAKNGNVSIEEFVGDVDEKTLEAIKDYREWAEKAQDVKQQIQETATEISNLRVEELNTVTDSYNNYISLIRESLNDQIQAEIDLLAEKGERMSEKLYKTQKSNSEWQLKDLRNQRKEMQVIFDEAVKTGDVKVKSDQWYEMLQAIEEMDVAITECEIDIESYQNAINNLHWERFEEITDRIGNVTDELKNFRSLISDDDIADEMGNWTKEGVTAIGLLAQQMEAAEYSISEYKNQIAYLEKEYKKGAYSESEYAAKLKELQEGQWSSIEAYESAKDEIIALNKARVSAAKDGIQKEIDAYTELINKQKESLNSEKEAHSFQKSVAEKEKEISDIQKKINAMSGDNTLSGMAQKKKLQEELNKVQEELDELYYDHSIETQQNALDQSLNAYEEERNAEIDKLEEYLTDEEQLLKDSFDLVLQNTEQVSETLEELVKKYGITASDAIVSPWQDGSLAIDEYKEKLTVSSSEFIDELNGIKSALVDLQQEADKTGQSLVDNIKKEKQDTEDATPNPVGGVKKPTVQPVKKKSTSGMVSSISKTLQSGSSGSDVKKLQTALNELGYTDSNGKKLAVDGNFGSCTKSAVKKFQKAMGISQDGVVGPETKKKFKAKGYAKGTTSVPYSGVYQIDENQLEELVLHAGANGRLEFLTKGSSVIPGDLTKNLMEIGQLDPSEVLKRNTPTISAPHIINNNMSVNMDIAEVVHIDHADSDSIQDITKAVKTQMDQYFKSVNQSMRKYVR